MKFRIGDWVKIGYFYGKIQDIAKTQQGIIMIQVKSFKELRVRHGSGCEWLEYKPDMWGVASLEDVKQDAYNELRLAEKQLDDLREFVSEVENV